MWLQHPVWPGEGDSCPFAFGARSLRTILEHDFGAAPGTGVFQAAPRCAALCHRLGSQVSSGTLWLGSIPLCCPQGALHGRAGGPRRGWRRRCPRSFQRFSLLLPSLPCHLLLQEDTWKSQQAQFQCCPAWSHPWGALLGHGRESSPSGPH